MFSPVWLKRFGFIQSGEAELDLTETREQPLSATEAVPRLVKTCLIVSDTLRVSLLYKIEYLTKETQSQMEHTTSLAAAISRYLAGHGSHGVGQLMA
jgi:hypothetical protein